ncbi:BREX system Lon protease-like protein BrxL [Candidatus Cryosericum hinesii]|jgi:ATP-dependent Lon protease|uniref:BREX system Lon protease-like protein BrxL n=1 Tax=Candidatus Cryosericum hinesii TaxID=2290915 RepID=A0A398DHT0_9BACT|nr:BREX system Lon protease-like protein BrxL [Candidatus Cryosericum hinesii]RIE11767.1 BREX system Lon protease-like protein BrxL [Candidatus Cryosericum hinesii]
MDTLDEKLVKIFPNESVLKNPENYSAFGGRALPSFIRDWLVKKYADDAGSVDGYALARFLQEHIPDKETSHTIKGQLTKGEDVQLLMRMVVEVDVKTGSYRLAIPDLGVKANEASVNASLLHKHRELLGGEVWGVGKLTWIAPTATGKKDGHIELIDFKPFKPYDVDIEYYRQARDKFTVDEWVNLLIKSMEYNPGGFEGLTQKLRFLARLLPFVQQRLNMVELAPKGTGKSYVFGNLTKYGWLISGGTVTRAKLFYDMQKNSPGIVTSYDYVAMDEVATIVFADADELAGAMKNYLESGAFTVGKSRQEADAGFVLLGNIPLTSDLRPRNSHYFEDLPPMFRESALLDRFHGFIEGWYLPRIQENLKVRGYTLNVEYFSEVLHALRSVADYDVVVGEMLVVPTKADTRDVTAVKRLCAAYLRLLFPNVHKSKDITPADFDLYCLQPALEKRAIIRRQAHLVDSEFREEMPDITVKRDPSGSSTGNRTDDLFEDEPATPGA